MTAEELKKDIKFAAIIVMHNVRDKGQALQIFCDLLSSADGHILGARRKSKDDPQVVKLFFTNPDLVYADTWPFPRLGPGSFKLSLEVVFKALYGFDIEYSHYGKPYALTFDYAEQFLNQ